MENSQEGRQRELERRLRLLSTRILSSGNIKIPPVLLELKAILSSEPPGSKNFAVLKRLAWKNNFVHYITLFLKQDYTLVEGGWTTAAELATILSKICVGMDVVINDNEFLENELPKAIENLFILASHLQTKAMEMTNAENKKRIHEEYLENFKTILNAILYITSGYIFLTESVLKSQLLLQMLMSDDNNTVVPLLNLIQNIVRANWKGLSKVDESAIHTILDESIYKLSVNSDPAVGVAATRCVLTMCDCHKPLIDMLCIRYRGLRPLLSKWMQKGFQRDLKELLRLLDAGNAQRAEREKYHIAATVIQAAWRSYVTRKHLRQMDILMGKLQRLFRKRRQYVGKKKEDERQESELRHQLQVQRRRTIRAFREKQLLKMEIVPADRMKKYIEHEAESAVIMIQKVWRGYSERKKIYKRQEEVKFEKAAIKIQRMVRKKLQRNVSQRNLLPLHLKPQGLTEHRYIELQQRIQERRDKFPTKLETLGEQRQVHSLAAELLAQYYAGIKTTRRNQQQREALLAQLSIDSELVLSGAPHLKDVTNKDVEIFSSSSLPIVTRAKVAHKEHLKHLRQPWWKKLGDVYQENITEEENNLLF